MPPPVRAMTASGRELDLTALAAEVCAAYFAEFPEDAKRYGAAGHEWCRHDSQHVLNWAVLDERLEVDFEGQLAWLAGVLEAREFPLAHLARNLELMAAAIAEKLPGEPQIGDRLRAGAASLRSRNSLPG